MSEQAILILGAEIVRWRDAFADLLEVAEDMRCYVPEYFAEKWKHDEGLAAAREFLASRPCREEQA